MWISICLPFRSTWDNPKFLVEFVLLSLFFLCCVFFIIICLFVFLYLPWCCPFIFNLWVWLSLFSNIQMETLKWKLLSHRCTVTVRSQDNHIVNCKSDEIIIGIISHGCIVFYHFRWEDEIKIVTRDLSKWCNRIIKWIKLLFYQMIRKLMMIIFWLWFLLYIHSKLIRLLVTYHLFSNRPVRASVVWFQCIASWSRQYNTKSTKLKV